MLADFFVHDPAPEFLVNGSYNIALVLLSIAVAIFASYFALQLRVFAQSQYQSKSYYFSTILSAASFAGGVWAMHFIGMLAFSLCVNVSYDYTVTAVSIVPSFITSVIAFHLLSTRNNSHATHIMCALLLGSGIGLMHYSGMTAMRLSPQLAYDPALFALSIAVAVALAWLGVISHVTIERKSSTKISLFAWRLLSAIIMGTAVSGMHYTGMQATRIISSSPYFSEPDVNNHTLELGLTIAILSVLLSSVVALVHGILRYQRLLHKQQADQSRLQAVLDTAVDGIITINTQAHILSFNPGAQRILGYQADEVIGKNVKVLMPDMIAQAHDGYLNNYYQTGQRQIIGSGREVKARHKDGHLIDIRLGVGEAKLEHNERLFVGFITDLSAQKEMQNQLAQQEHHYRTLLKNMPGVAFKSELEQRWNMSYVSPAVLALTGYTDHDFIEGNIDFEELVHSSDRNMVVEYTFDAAKQKLPAYSYEYRIVDKSNSVRWVLDRGSLEPQADGRVVISGVLMDITERRHMEQALLQEKNKAESAAAAKQAFLTNMSHEIRTPMNSIIGFSEVLLEGPLNKQQRQQLSTVLECSRSLLHLLNDILDSAKLEQGKLTVSNTYFSLLSLLDSAISSFAQQASSKGLKLHLDIEDYLYEHRVGDDKRIRQVLNNLLSNAIKFTESGSVTLQVKEKPNSEVLFCVSDTGIGIAPERQAAIFEPFEQEDDSTTRRFGGTGLGISICKDLVELMGGHIYLSSELNQGSSFSFVIPLSKTEAPMHTKEAEQEEESLPPLEVLVVDDVEQNVHLVQVRLSKLGHTVSTACNGLEAIELVQKNKFDVVLMDVHMPQCDGLAASRRIRQWEQEHDAKPVPIIALTASVTPSDREAAKAAQMNGFASKPIEIEQLLAEIARVIGGHIAQVRMNTLQRQNAQLINFKKGESMWGSAHKYTSQLQQFLTEHFNSLTELMRLSGNLSAQDLHQIHTLRGLAANLALEKLADLLAHLESLGEINDDKRFALAALSDELYDNLQQLGKVDLPQNDKPHMTQMELIHKLDMLIDMASSYEYDEQFCHDCLLRCPSEREQEMQSIVNALDNFDFDLALTRIRILQTKLDEDVNANKE